MPYQPLSGGGLDVPKKDPNYHYRWLDYMNKDNLKMHLRSHGAYPPFAILQGLTVDKTKEICIEHGMPVEYVSASKNWIEWGYCVLARIPMSEFLRRRAEATSRARSLNDQANEAYLNSAEGIKGVTPIIREMEEHEDRKRFETSSHKSRISLSRATN